MNTNLTQEQISALVDGELDAPDTEAILALLQRPEGRAAWEAYHQVGDVLRSDETGLTMSPDFSRHLFARLDAEPTVIAPLAIPATTVAALPVQTAPTPAFASRQALRRFALPGMVAAAAVATVAFVTTPQLMVADGVPATRSAIVATTQPILTNAALESPVALVAAGVSTPTDEVILRDPRIDDYLFAHQRFSPSVYSTAQFARSATFASTSGN